MAKQAATKVKTETKRSYLSQADVPSMSIDDALKVPRAIVENYAGAATPPIKVAKVLNIEPLGSKLRSLCGASIAYGFITGGAQAAEISITETARRILKPLKEGDELAARREAFLKPRIVGEFLRRYNGAQIPRDDIATNVIEELGVPSDKVSTTLALITEGASLLGLVQEIKGKKYVDLSGMPVSLASAAGSADETVDAVEPDMTQQPLAPVVTLPLSPDRHAQHGDQKVRVFVSHGKNRQIMLQIKEILTFGKFDAVVSIDKESTAIPVPDKVFEDMRNCRAGVIHVANEGELLDTEGNKVPNINDNVLIEIGAAIALYKKNFVLLVEKGIRLPSNLQGLYRCEYEGDKLDYEATMKLLKTFNEFRLS